MPFRVVNTDNFGGDYPDESFVGEPYDTREEAEIHADALNHPHSNYAARYHKVVELPYTLQPGFEP